MPTLAERILNALGENGGPMTDAQLAEHLGEVHQAVNQACRKLETQGPIKRAKVVGGNIQNVLLPVGVAPPNVPEIKPQTATPRSPRFLAEDEVKQAVKDYLEPNPCRGQ